VRLVVITLALLAGIPESSWIPADITAGKKPVRVVITKTGWRSGPEALVLERKRDVQTLYDALAGNARLGWMCGYHWNVAFEYEGAPPESIDINESCETFRRDPKATWRIVSSAVKKAKAHPSHFVALLQAEGTTGDKALCDAASRFGLVIHLPERRLLAVREPWSPARIARVDRALHLLGHLKAIEVADTGN
jgi:hypothetical protein